MNKKLVQILAFVFLVAIGANAQPLTLGVKAGLNSSKLTGQSFGGYSTSFNGGIYAASTFNQKWGWQIEVGYNNQIENINTAGFNTVYTPSETNNDVSSTATIGTVAIPFLFTYKLNNFFSLHAGPQVSFNAYTSQNMFENGSVPFKVVDFWGCIGGNLDLGGINFYLRYNNGFTNINSYDNPNRDKWMNRQINFGLEVPVITLHKKK